MSIPDPFPLSSLRSKAEPKPTPPPLNPSNYDRAKYYLTDPHSLDATRGLGFAVLALIDDTRAARQESEANAAIALRCMHGEPDLCMVCLTIAIREGIGR